MAFVKFTSFHLNTVKRNAMVIYNGVYSFANDKYTIDQPSQHGIPPFQIFIRNNCFQSDQIPWEGSSSATLLAKFETALKHSRIDEAWESFSDYKRLHGLPSQSVISKLVLASSYSSHRHWLHKAYQLMLIILRDSPALLHYDPLSRLALTLARTQIPVPASTILRIMLVKKMLPKMDVLNSIFFHLVKTKIGCHIATNILVELSENYLQQKEKSKLCLRTKLIKPTTALFNIVLKSSIQFGFLIKAQKLINIMKVIRLPVDVGSLVMISHLYEITGQRHELRTLENLVTSNATSTSLRHLQYHFYDCLLSLHFKFNDIDSAANLILGLSTGSAFHHNPQKPDSVLVQSSNLSMIGKQEILQTEIVDGVENKCGLILERNGKFMPSKKALAKLICGFVRERRVHELSTILASLEKEGSSSEETTLCSDVMDACRQLGWLDTMHDILDDMESYKISVDPVHYKSLLKAYLSENMLEEANVLMSQMKRVGILTDFSDDGYTFNSLKIFACHDIDTESHSLAKNACLVHLLGSESKDDVQSRQLVYELNSSILFFCKSKMMEDSMRTLRKMQERTVQPTVYTFSYLVDGFSSLNMYREITILWGEIKRRLESGMFSADRDLFDCLLLNFIRGGYFERIMEIVKYMNRYNMFVDKWIYRREFLMLHRSLYRNLKASDATTDAQRKRLQHVQDFRKFVGIGVKLHGFFG